ncbi:MAG: dynamin family protein [Gammaproteobacteria bacterium]|nr:dynamin family protein [Gammaproteobacteria bacterium]
MALPIIGIPQPLVRPPTATINAFGRRLSDYKNWRDELAVIISDYQSWVETQGLGHGEDDLRVYELIDALKYDKLTVALVAEFSRGKTELINAIFFADYKQRLLPSDAGRTTMCPTELLYEEREPPCVKLLPIETRKSSLTIAEYKHMAASWSMMSLDLQHPKAMAEALQQIVQTKMVSVREAEELGLYNRLAPGVMPPSDGKIQIPLWRHAIINFPHPLLKQGLVVLDTPGLNSLGTEPELTMSMLPSAHAVLFVLAADTGVTKSDLDVWVNHVCIARRGPSDAQLVVLNKVDALWDELRTADTIATTLTRQIDETSKTLGVNPRSIFPVSAQKGLVGKIKADRALIERSGLIALETKLSTDIIAAKQALMRDKIAREIGSIVDHTRAMIEARLASVKTQLAELQSVSGKSQAAIQQMISHMRGEKQAYDQTLNNFQHTRAALSEASKILLDYLSVESFDALLIRTRNAMQESWTTPGLQVGMKLLFDGAIETMEKADRQAQQILTQVQSIHHKFLGDRGLARLQPTALSLAICKARMQRLREEAEAFRKSPVTLMTEQHFVIKKFFITLGSRARVICADCNTAARHWSKAIMAPILAQVREQKMMMDHRLENLKRIHQNLGNLSGRIADLEANKQNLENQLLIIDNMLRKIGPPNTSLHS